MRLWHPQVSDLELTYQSLDLPISNWTVCDLAPAVGDSVDVGHLAELPQALGRGRRRQTCQGKPRRSPQLSARCRPDSAAVNATRVGYARFRSGSPPCAEDFGHPCRRLRKSTLTFDFGNRH
jgi:hypothetical protein